MDQSGWYFFFKSRIFLSQDFFQLRIFFPKRRIFPWSWKFCNQDGIFTSSREYFCQVENYFFESNSVNLSIIFSRSQDFLLSANFFFNSRIPNMPCHLLPKWSKKMVACRFVVYIAFLYIVVILQVVTVFLLSVQDCIYRIAQCTALGNVEYIHDCSEGFV